MIRVVLVGATGFLGSYLTQYLAADREVAVTAVARTLKPTAHDLGGGVEWYQADLASPVDCAELADRADVIVHLAHTGTPLTSNADLPSDAALNLIPTVTLVQAIRLAARSVHVVYASSGGAVYGGEGNTPFRETDACRPRSSYGVQKLAAEHYLRLAADEGWMTATVLRIGNPYGVVVPPERRQSFIGVAVANIIRGTPVRLFGSLENVRDYLHLSDMAAAFRLAIGRPRGFEMFNIGSGVGYSVRDVLRLLERTAAGPFAIEHFDSIDGASNLPRWVILDTGLAKRELGWSATCGLPDGIARLFAEAQAR